MLPLQDPRWRCALLVCNPPIVERRRNKTRTRTRRERRRRTPPSALRIVIKPGWSGNNTPTDNTWTSIALQRMGLDKFCSVDGSDPFWVSFFLTAVVFVWFLLKVGLVVVISWLTFTGGCWLAGEFRFYAAGNSGSCCPKTAAWLECFRASVSVRG